MTKPNIYEYECPNCHEIIIVSRGKDTTELVHLKCGVWMRFNGLWTEKLLNDEVGGKAGSQAISIPEKECDKP